MSSISDHIIRIAVTGPESTGKSKLSRQLALHFGEPYVQEYARSYIEQLNRPYEQHDILEIAGGQLANEQQAALKAKKLLFCDTEFLVTKIWSLHKYRQCHPWIQLQIEQHRYDFYLLCNIDLPWEFDEQREHPHLRQYFFDWYKRELESHGLPWGIVSGQGSERFESAIKLLEPILK